MFIWDTNKAFSNFDKHGISFEEAVTVFNDSEALDWQDLAHSEFEQRFKRVGKSSLSSVLIVIYTVRRLSNGKTAIRIISARQASRRERKAYAR